jgi:regulator of protease activity HflC (stomatin/prohibitin superfamily)
MSNNDGFPGKAKKKVSPGCRVLVLVAIAVLLAGCQRDVSGKYLAKYTDGLCWLQLVRTPDNHLTGQLETYQLQSDGKINHNVVPLTGAVNGDNMTLSATALGITYLSLAGAIEGGKLRLTGIQADPVILERADLPAYQRELAALNQQSEKTISARAAAAAQARAEQERADTERAAEVSREQTARSVENLVSEIDQIAAKVEQLNGEADVHLARFSSGENGFRAITARIGEYLDRERLLAGRANAGVARGQLVVAMNQALIGTEQLHNEAQTLQYSVQSAVQPVVVQIGNLTQACETGIPVNDVPQSIVDARASACERLRAVSGAFRQKFDTVARGLGHIEGVYGDEKQKQQRLIETAQRLQ